MGDTPQQQAGCAHILNVNCWKHDARGVLSYHDNHFGEITIPGSVLFVLFFALHLFFVCFLHCEVGFRVFSLTCYSCWLAVGCVAMCVADLLELKRHGLRVDLHAQVREQPGASGRTVSPGGLSTRISKRLMRLIC